MTDLLDHLSNDNKEELYRQANNIRKQQFGNVITASKNYFIPIIQYCRNSCLYCGFSRKSMRAEFGTEEDPSMIIHPDTLLEHLKIASKYNCREILIVMGDRPEEVSSTTREFLDTHGFANSIEYTYWACERSLEFGLEPHVNIGVLTKQEWEYLQPVMGSAGLMLESTSTRLTQKGLAHTNSPDKNPKVRIDSIKYALELEIPFTSGILVGIGETSKEIIETIDKLAEFGDEFTSLQEIIVQGFHPLVNTPWRNKATTPAQLLLDTLVASRITLPKHVNLQFPPNLGAFQLTDGIFAGANDLGGVSPKSIDHVNFSSPWPQWDTMETELANYDLLLVERGPVYSNWKKYSKLKS